MPAHDLDRRVVVRKNHSENPAGPSEPEIVPDDLIVIYLADPQNPLKANYRGGEAHRVHFANSSPRIIAEKENEMVTGMNTAKGTFEVEVRLLPSENNFGDTNIARFSMDKKWSGDLAGTSHGQMLGFQSQTEKGTGGGVAMERFSGTLRGRSGSFLLQHNSTMRNGKFEMNISVVPGSGTEDLAGISGTLQIVVEGSKHSYRFEYSISSN